MKIADNRATHIVKTEQIVVCFFNWLNYQVESVVIVDEQEESTMGAQVLIFT